MKLTLAQHCALVDLSEGDTSAYRMGTSLNTLWSLNNKGLAMPLGGSGRIAFPRSSLWRITYAGRQALKDEGTRT